MFSNKTVCYHSKKIYTRIPDLPSSPSTSLAAYKQRRKKATIFLFISFLFLLYFLYGVLSGLQLPVHMKSCCGSNNNNTLFLVPSSSNNGERPVLLTPARIGLVNLSNTTMATTHYVVPSATKLPGTEPAQLTATTRNPSLTTSVSKPSGKYDDENEKMACVIPKLDPYDKKIKHLFNIDDAKLNCSDVFPLLFDCHEDSSIVPRTKSIRTAGYDSCCYRTIHRKNMYSDNGFTLSSGNCYPISVENSTIVTDEQHEFLAIFCKFASNQTDIQLKGQKGKREKIVEKIVDTHVLVHLKPTTEKQIAEYYNNLKKTNDSPALLEHERVNVVILVLDAVSHMNFIRMMPSVHSYLVNNLSAVEMQSFNKVGDNTLPNAVPFLTSSSLPELKRSGCMKGKTFDNCPWIWKEYAARGYRTSFGEDAPGIAMFNMKLKGFITPPTTYYLRPFSVAVENLMIKYRLSYQICYGPRLALEQLLDYMKKLAYRMGHDKRYFQLIWETALTHDLLNYGHLGEKALLSTLQWFHDNGYLNQTAFILLSDHGMRFGKIRDFFQGQLEDRLPFLYFILPDWFKKKYSRAYENLLTNRDRLSTHFDLHKTLIDLLDLNSISPGKLATRESELTKDRKKLPRGISQFIPIPKFRTCEMAGVPEHFCVCHNTAVLGIKDPIVEEAANVIVSSINAIISNATACAPLTLDRIKQAFAIETNFNSRKAYQITLETSPGGGVFESLVEKDKKGAWKMPDISRTNVYGNQSHCVEDRELRSYCYCVDIPIPDIKEKGEI